MKKREFVERVEALLIKQGATVIEDYPGYSYKWMLDTKMGNLRLYADPPIRGCRVYTVFSRFDDPGLAAAVRCNQFSGKWNIHEWTAEKALLVLEDRLAAL